MPTAYNYRRLAPAHRTGTNGLVVGSAAWPMTATGGETMDKITAWLDRPVMATHPGFKNKHATAIGVVGLAALAWYGSKNRWF